jgi:hypothetical protein
VHIHGDRARGERQVLRGGEAVGEIGLHQRDLVGRGIGAAAASDAGVGQRVEAGTGVVVVLEHAGVQQLVVDLRGDDSSVLRRVGGVTAVAERTSQQNPCGVSCVH